MVHATSTYPHLDRSHRALICRWRGGDASALFELLNLHRSSLLGRIRKASSSRTRYTIEDYQDLFTDLALFLAHRPYAEIARAGDLEKPSVFLALCSEVVRRVVGRSTDKFGYEIPTDDSTLDALTSPPDGIYFPADHSFRMDLDRAYELISKQDPELMEVLALSVNGGLTAKELADHFHTSPRTIYRRMKRARSALRDALELGGLQRAKEGQPADLPRTEELIVDAPRVKIELVSPELLIALQRHPDLLKTLHWHQFELLLAQILESFEYEVELTSRTADGGVDIFALKRDGDFGPERYLLQAKRWSNAVGVASVRELLFLHNYHRVSKSCLATTSTFTRGAWELGWEHRWQLDLRDFDLLRKWIEKVRKTTPGAQ